MKRVKFDECFDKMFDFRGKTPKKIDMDWGGGDIPALSANNVKMGKIDFSQPTYYGSEKLYNKWMNKGNLKKGDVLMTMEAPLGNTVLIPDNKKYI
ncbi:restriction endonuclease subunit S, partial [Clostridium perfringens]|nr:restriction endonuclease subunit S [Clostridium perfringens]